MWNDEGPEEGRGKLSGARRSEAQLWWACAAPRNPARDAGGESQKPGIKGPIATLRSVRAKVSVVGPRERMRWSPELSPWSMSRGSPWK
jgi:hypothetical protein